MKYFIHGLIYGLLAGFSYIVLSTVVHAQETPAALKDAEVTVTLKDGSSYKFSSNQYAVVPRKVKAAPVAIVKTAKAVKKNAVKLYAGYGQDGYDVALDGGRATVKQSYGLNYGLGLQRDLSEGLFVDGIVILNQSGAQSGLLGLGLRF